MLHRLTIDDVADLQYLRVVCLVELQQCDDQLGRRPPRVLPHHEPVQVEQHCHLQIRRHLVFSWNCCTYTSFLLLPTYYFLGASRRYDKIPTEYCIGNEDETIYLINLGTSTVDDWVCVYITYLSYYYPQFSAH